MSITSKVNFIILVFCALMIFHFPCMSEEVFNSELEQKCLTNIRQLTFPDMGFEKAGEGYFSPDNKTILFQAIPKGEEYYQIFSMNLDEGIPRKISPGKSACTCAYFRPDGKKVIFASSHTAPPNATVATQKATTNNSNYKWDLTPHMNIYEANPDGSELTALTTGPAYHAECAYSSDGSQIVYASNEDGSMNIYTMKSNGSDVRQITHSTYCYNGGPFFSPDGQRIIFRADRDEPDYLQIYVINVDGSNEMQLTLNKSVNWAPYWHPNGKVIAFTTSLHGHRHYEIYLMNIETGIFYRLTHNETFDGLPVFSNEGNQLLWTSKRGLDNTCQIFIADFHMPQALN